MSPVHYSVIFFLLFSAAFPFGETCGQEATFRNYNTENGLASSEVYCVKQDSRGYMWFGTDAGISVYDGYGFRNYGPAEGIPDNVVYHLQEDKKGRMWFSTTFKVGYIFKDKVFLIPANDTVTSAIRQHLINYLGIDGDTVLLLTNSVKKISISPPYRKKGVKVIYGAQSEYSLGDLHRILNSRQEAALLHGKKLLLPADTFSLDYSYFLKTGGKGILFSVTRKLFIIKDSVARPLMDLPALITWLYQDSAHNIWVALANKGILMFPGGNFDSAPERFLESFTVTGIVEDREKGIWITTLTGGIFYLKNRDITQYNVENALLHNVNSIVKTGNEQFLIGQENGMLGLIDSKKGNVNHFPESFFGDPVKFLFNSGNLIWIMGANYAQVIDKGHRIKARLSFWNVKSMIKSRDGNIWLCNHNEIYKVSPGNLKILKALKRLRFRCMSLFEDPGGLLWIGCVDGLRTYDGKDFYYYGKHSSLLRAKIVSMGSDHRNRIWLATKGRGIIVIEGNRVRNITEKDGLCGDICKKISITKDAVWVATSKGLSRIRISGENPVAECYDIKDGLPSNEINDLQADGSKLLIVTYKGVSVFDTSALVHTYNPPPVYLTGINVSGKPAGPGTDSLVLPFNESYLILNFKGLSYKNPGNLIYKYQMDGLGSGEWLYTSNTSVQYPQLPSGKYTFSVYAVNGYGESSVSPARLFVTILPPWWELWWFRLAVLLLLAGGVVLIFINRLGKIKREQARRMEYREQVMSLELKALRAQMNPHFIFNALNSIQLFILKNEGQAAYDYLNKFSRLIRNVLENSRNPMISLAQELESLVLYIELECLRFKNKFTYTLNLDPGIDKHSICIPSMIFQPYVENAIWHGLMPQEGEKKLSIRIHMDSEKASLHCIIEDNGIGREASQKLRSASTRAHNSMGLSVTRDRLKILNVLLQRNSEIIIHDLQDNDKKPVGTRVEIFLPLAYDQSSNSRR